jgi:hypothetical protein
MEERTSTMIMMPDREVWSFVNDKKSDNDTNFPTFLYFGFLNSWYFAAKGFIVKAARKMQKRKISVTFWECGNAEEYSTAE